MDGHSAVTPVFTRAPGAAQQYKDGVTGHPGTAAVAMDRTQGRVPRDVSQGPVAQAMMGTARSGDAPDAIYPNKYWAEPEASFRPGAGMPVSVYSDNLMPVPASDPRGTPAPMQMGLGVGFSPTQGQIRQPAPLIMWPSANA